MTISALLVNSREDVHPEWVNTALFSIEQQFVKPDELIVVNNIGRRKTIGQCYNEGIRQCSGDFVIFLDDDDWWARDYVQVLKNYAMQDKKNRHIAYTCFMTAYNDIEGDPSRGTLVPLIDRIHRGLWRREYLLQYPYNEELTMGVDREHIEEVKKRGDSIFVVTHYFGYYYRKHNDYSCATKINFSMNPKDVYICATQRNFVNPIASKLGEGRCSVLTNPFNTEMADKAKVIWCEWGNVNAVRIAKYPCEAKKILRIHAYEAYTTLIYDIDYSKYNTVIFIADHIKEYVEEKVGDIPNAVVIPNGVNTNRFNFERKEKNNKIAWAGIIGRKKGVGLLMHLAWNNPDYEFHVAGRYDGEDDSAQWVNEKKPDNMYIHSFQYNIEDFFKDKTYILNTSIREGCPVTVLEGMAMGLKPLIYTWIGAEEQFQGYVFKTQEDFRRLLKNIEPSKYRQFILENHDFDKIYEEQIKDLFEVEELVDG